MTGKELVRDWLLTKVGEKITDANLEIELYAYQQRFGKHYLPGSLTRYFRFVREEGLRNYEIKEVSGKYKTWMVVEKEKQLELM